MITIGLPFYNAEDTLADTLRSVFAQTFQDWELILVDDGSTDRSLEMARAVKDPRVRVISDGKNCKLPARLNQIVSEAKYDLIARMDADDMMSPRRLARQLEEISDPKLQIVTSGMCMISDDNRPIGYRGRANPRITSSDLLRGHGIAHGPLLGRTQWFVQNPYDPFFPRSQDAELWCRSRFAGNLPEESVLSLEEPLYFCREEVGLSLDKIMASHRVVRSLLLKYGPGYFGRCKTYWELLRSHQRSNILRVCNMMGLLAAITTRTRNRPMDDPEMKTLVESEIEIVLSTKVPGID